jgi:hypothetical protein
MGQPGLPFNSLFSHMSESPSNETLASMLEDMKLTLYEIKTQCVSTNGRVKSLELWKSFLLGAWAITVLSLPFILTMFWYLMSNQIEAFHHEITYEIQSKIQANNQLYFEDPLPPNHK